ncbi:hypothetical protein PHJA_003033200 [Phtheirospermum japonicum]|uniref:Uncharacterized protein n=1 Tax=Phtheirospermum japonicum TaxID=374723 RepID=A0A830DAA7_9LAMI|nr:hypothetical protein PHJA_003033200 [Phtheirospermum japonicum]
MLLKTERGLFSLGEVELKGLNLRAIETGFEMGSRMLVYGILVLYSNSAETINKKIKLLQRFGFTKDECNEVFVEARFALRRPKRN